MAKAETGILEEPDEGKLEVLGVNERQINIKATTTEDWASWVARRNRLPGNRLFTVRILD